METIAKQQSQAEALLVEGERQQQRLDELFADADRAKSIAEDAVKRASDTLRDAKDMLERLKSKYLKSLFAVFQPTRSIVCQE